MSGPAAPYSTGTTMLSPAELQKFEAPLIALANLSGGDLRKLFHAFFSFLHARTDFYILESEEDGDGGGSKMGFKEGQAERILLASFRQFPLRKVAAPTTKVEEKSANDVSTGEEAKYSARTASVDSLETTTTIGTMVTSTSIGSNEDTVGAVVLPQQSDNSKKKSLPSKLSSVKSKSKVRYTDEGKQVPIGNGGSTSRYVWTQTLEEIIVHIPIPEGVRAKDLDVSIGADSLSIHRTKKNVAEEDVDETVSEVNAENNDNSYDILPLEGTLYARIRPSESTWTLEVSAGGSSNISTWTLQLILEKVQKTWWETVISGDTPLIDATMVDSTRHIGTYDEETQAEIRRNYA
jgi:hypothetical protein